MRMTQQQLSLLRSIEKAPNQQISLNAKGKWFIGEEYVPEILVISLLRFRLIEVLEEQKGKDRTLYQLNENGRKAIVTNELPRQIILDLCKARELEAREVIA
jgi:hypothetical protein